MVCSGGEMEERSLLKEREVMTAVVHSCFVAVATLTLAQLIP